MNRENTSLLVEIMASTDDQCCDKTCPYLHIRRLKANQCMAFYNFYSKENQSLKYSFDSNRSLRCNQCRAGEVLARRRDSSFTLDTPSNVELP